MLLYPLLTTISLSTTIEMNLLAIGTLKENLQRQMNKEMSIQSEDEWWNRNMKRS
jgi:hypothetical protein